MRSVRVKMTKRKVTFMLTASAEIKGSFIAGNFDGKNKVKTFPFIHFLKKVMNSSVLGVF